MQCNTTFKANSCIGFYSFSKGEIPTIPPDPDVIDLAYCFDEDDCSEGALIGNDERPGYLFPIGYQSWSELVKLKHPLSDEGSIGAIMPLTKDKEGFAFWVKTKNGFILAKIISLQTVSYSDIVSGTIPSLELEWYKP